MSAKDSITVHGRLPNLNVLALGIGGGAVLIGAILAPLLVEAAWGTLAGVVAGGALLLFALSYCRVTVTPWEVRVLGSGIWKGRYSCPLAEAAAHGSWLLPEWAAQAAYYSPCLNFSSEEDWDTGVEYVEITFYGEQVLNLFRYQQLPEVLAALRAMAARRRELEAAPASILPPADYA